MRRLHLVLGLLLAAGCGGGGYDSSTPYPNTSPSASSAAVSIGVMTKGSVIVNGVRYDDTFASTYGYITIDDRVGTSADLRDGMLVKVSGTVNADGVSGTAQYVRTKVEARGTPSSVNAAATPPSLIVQGQTVYADDRTVYSNLAGFAAITTSTLIEVHGLRDASGAIRATRIEANTAQMGDAALDEIRGIVSGGAGTNPASFNIGTQAVTLSSGAVITPTGATYQNGAVVEVQCSARPCISAGVFQASRIKVEDAADTEFAPASGQRLEAEGLISGFTAHPGTFSVGRTSVTTSSSTRFSGGIASDLKNDIQIEAEGTWNGSSLVASRIEFKSAVIRLQGTTANATANSFDLKIANNAYTVSIAVDAMTSGAVPANGIGCIQVRGRRKSPSSPLVVIASEINLTCANGNRHLIQAPVEAKSPETTITLLGLAPIDISAPSDASPYLDASGQSITRTAFFSAIAPATTNAASVAVAGSLVKVIFDTGASTVKQVEIED